MKYDCTKAKDFLHELSRLMVACNKAEKPIPCAGCPLAVYDVEFLCLGKTTFASGIFSEISENKFNDIVKRLQKWSDSHPERRELTVDEAAVLVGLKLLGFKHIAADKDKTVWAYTEIPEKDVKYWTNRGVGSSICISYTGLFVGIADFSDENPLVIDEILNKRNR